MELSRALCCLDERREEVLHLWRELVRAVEGAGHQVQWRQPKGLAGCSRGVTPFFDPLEYTVTDAANSSEDQISTWPLEHGLFYQGESE